MSKSAIAIVVMGGLSLAAILFIHGNANAASAWCGYSGQAVECGYDSEAACRKNHRECMPNPSK